MMNWLLDGASLNTREIAVMFWLVIAVTAFSLKREGRTAIWGVVRALFQPILLAALAVATLWIGFSVFLMERQGLWEITNLKTTILWAITFAFVTMFDLENIGKPDFAGKVVRDTINATAIVVFIAEFATFRLLIELVFVPFLILLGFARAVADTKMELAAVRKLLNGLAVFVGFGILAYSVHTISQEFSNFARRSTALEFSVPIILSLLFLPFILIFGRWVAYERVFSSFFYAVPNIELRKYARWRGLRAFRTDIEGLDRWGNTLIRRRPETRADVDDAVAEIKLAQGRERDPPEIESEVGWSPYAAKAFLDRHGLTTSAWQHLGDDEWSCSARLVDLDDGLMPNRLGYYVLGDATVACRIRLKLYINNPALAQTAEARFVEAAHTLLEQTDMGQFAMLLDDLSLADSRTDGGTNDRVVTLTRENWVGGISGGYERMLTVRSRSFEAADN